MQVNDPRNDPAGARQKTKGKRNEIRKSDKP